MSKANITSLVQNPQESIDRLQTLSLELKTHDKYIVNGAHTSLLSKSNSVV